MSTLKTELCQFSQYRLHPGHGKKYARVDGKIFNFMTRKCARCYMMKRNPRDTRWTILYRKKNKKGQIAEVTRVIDMLCIRSTHFGTDSYLTIYVYIYSRCTGVFCSRRYTGVLTN